jgi:hypothetical protein
VFLCVAALAASPTPCLADAPEPAAGLPDGDGGLAGLTPEQITALRQARDMLAPLALVPSDDEGSAMDLLTGLQRVHEGLNDWGMAGQAEAYLRLAFTSRNGRVQATAIACAQSSAKARNYHLGGVQQLWRDIDANYPKDSLMGEAKQVRGEFLKCVESFSSDKKLLADLRPLKLDTPKLNLDDLKPYPETKSK